MHEKLVQGGRFMRFAHHKHNCAWPRSSHVGAHGANAMFSLHADSDGLVNANGPCGA
jgi:hypothetical protein